MNEQCKLILLDLKRVQLLFILCYAFTDEEAVQKGLIKGRIVGIVASLICLILMVGFVSIIVAVLVMKLRSKRPSKFSLWQISVTD